MAAAESIEDRVARGLSYQNVRESLVCRNMIARRNESQAIAFVERRGHQAGSLPARNGVAGPNATRGAVVLIILAGARIDFDRRFHFRIVIAPVCTQIGCRSVRDRGAAEKPQIS